MKNDFFKKLDDLFNRVNILERYAGGGGGGGGAVNSVNGKSGTVILNADDISDASTTKKFTNELAITKLAGIEDYAEVNVNADWNAVSGDSQILNKPTIPEIDTNINLGSSDVKVPSQKAVKTYVDNSIPSPSGSVPTGTILPFAGSTAPSQFLLCQGQAISRTTYSALFAVIGTTYGAGNGSTTFNLPSFAGRVPVGLSTETEFNTLGKKGGEKTHLLTGNELAGHTHQVPIAVDGLWASTGGVASGYQTYGGDDIQYGEISTDSGGEGEYIDQPHNNLQPYITINFLIKY